MFNQNKIENMVGVLIINLNNIVLTKNCINTLKKQNNQNFNIYLFDQNSSEEGTLEYLLECEDNGISVFRNRENISINYIWNDFKNICDYKYLCFLNNDVELSHNFIDDTIKILDSELNVGVVVHVTNNPNYLEANNKLVYGILKTPRYQGWDFTIKRELMPEIPKNLLFFGGDDYIFTKLYDKGFYCAIAYSSPIIHYKEKTRKNILDISNIQKIDENVLMRLMKSENLKQAYSTIDDGLSYKYPMLNMKINNNLK